MFLHSCLLYQLLTSIQVYHYFVNFHLVWHIHAIENDSYNRIDTKMKNMCFEKM